MAFRANGGMQGLGAGAKIKPMEIFKEFTIEAARYKETGFRLCCKLKNPNRNSVFGQMRRVGPR
jgi:hypothetical protein